MTVIDVDTHWEVGELRAGRASARSRGSTGSRPTGVELLAYGIAGDLLRALPDDRRPDGRELLPGLVPAGRASAAARSSCTRSTTRPPAERVAWMDRVGIDHCLVNPGGYWQLLEFLGADRPPGVRRCNDFLAEQLADDADRLHGVAVVDFTDLDAAVAELQHGRAPRATARSSSTPSTDGRRRATPPGHPDWDVVWSAAVDLGMIAVDPRRQHRDRLRRLGRHRLGPARRRRGRRR